MGVTVSIVSHGHGAMVDRLIRQLKNCPEVSQVILTCNIPESATLASGCWTEVIHNPVPLGFGANHNAAFRRCREPFFCVLNPDVELLGNPFPALIECLEKSNAALAAPLTQGRDGSIEDSIRHFPTIGSLLRKALGKGDGCYEVYAGQPSFPADWVAGMFMLFKREAFERVGGFDQAYFLYYEDVDICIRLWKTGLGVMACPGASVIHAAQRASHGNLRYLRWHLASMARYFWRHAGRLPDTSRIGLNAGKTVE